MVETAEREKANFITDMIYHPASEHNGYIHSQIVSGNEHIGLIPKKLVADSSYISGEQIKRYRDRRQELMGYTQGYAGPEKVSKTEAFEIDLEKRQAVCPAGVKSSSCGSGKSGNVYIYFDSKTC